MGNEVGENWEKWLRNFKLMLEIKQITDVGIRKALLLYSAGTQVQEIFYALPEEATSDEENEFEATARILTKHFVKKRNVTFERHIFRGLQQGPTEKIEQFVIRLRQQAQKCNFADQRDDNIKDQLIAKCLSADLKTKILDKGDELKLTDAVQLAMTHESVIEQLSAMKSAGNSLGIGSAIEQPVNRIQSYGRKPTSTTTCRRCGRRGHDGGDKCPAKAKTCYNCKKEGHFASKCLVKKSDSDKSSKKDWKSEQPPEKKKREESVQAVTTSKLTDYIFCLDSEELSDNEIWCTIGGIRMPAVVDSGSTHNLIDFESWTKMKSLEVVVKKMEEGTDRIFRAYGGNQLDIKGSVEAELVIGEVSSLEVFYVMNEKGKILIGSVTAKRMGILSIKASVTSNAINNIGSDAGQNEKWKPLSKIRDVLIKIPIDERVQPVQQRYRRVPVPLEEATDRKIQELLARDIIEKATGATGWVSPMVVIPKQNGDVRITIDMREANKAVMRENHPMPTFEEMLPHIGRGKIFSKLDVEQAFHQMELHVDSRNITTFITKSGLYRYKRLNMGIACAPEMFQNRMEIVLLNCPGA